ncbi:MAG TPA: bifunctional DNA-binding transcriptional regulator/O6-methylguanine-DNA methyltransferase Ada [Bryobacteraceae bacterium]|jgi:AraC family transcriptional regulator of adaptative response/methylated-DNA-[protein]-cysteine methyltransferase|nr:bifunctional DNA-binding transcriptional regulator/O6-methylguanine-DNA methyltransferase Ada [Bryobacteraceae bacterium]
MITEQLEDQTCWNAVQERDAAADDQFVYAVVTTGVYCRPSCPSRRAQRENVRFFQSCADAEEAGFRACKRCRPAALSIAQKQKSAVERICRLLEESDQLPVLATLAGAVSMSPFHLHRTFKTLTGLTPRAYFTAQRARRMRKELLRSETITDAIYNAGYGSGSRFYSESARVLGMTPTQFRQGGEELQVRFATEQCSLGLVLVAATETGICSILLGATVNELETNLRQMFPKAKINSADEEFTNWVSQVVAVVETPSRGLDLPLDVRGTAFQQRVWQALREIPAGETLTYTQVAERIGAPTSVRAVAHACATNPAAVAIPCHRVIGKNGNLSGYRWGIERKRALLEREQAQ